MIVKIVIPRQRLFALDYRTDLPEQLQIGDLVIVPFRSQQIIGIVIEVNIQSIYSEKLRPIYQKTKFPKISKAMVEFLLRTATYNMLELGTVFKMMMPLDITKLQESLNKASNNGDNYEPNLPPLSDNQQQAFEKVIKHQGTSLLKGVTGSGKTEIYFHLIAEILKSNGQSLILLPEIALSNQIISRFEQRFGFPPAIWNSSVSLAKKKKILLGIMQGDIKIVIGSRSALFLPYANLKTIIIDEEHDGSYKQEDSAIYNARDLSVLRGNIEQIPVILCSATPSLESYYNAQIGKYQLVELTSRYGQEMPHIEIVDMKKNYTTKTEWVSQKLADEIQVTLKHKHQVLIFLNRKGFAPLMLCKSCGYRYLCPNCSSWLVYYQSKKRLECSHCSFVSAIHKSCPECHLENSLIPCGPGVERIEEEIISKFPQAKTIVITRDHLQNQQEITSMINSIVNKEIDIIIGTQIITKGYHFPDLNLVGVIDADLGLKGGDLRAAEKNFQLLQQVSGRAGRAANKGKVLIQTYFPDNQMIKALSSADFETFIQEEIESRREMNMPPFSRIASLVISSSQEMKALEISKKLAQIAPNAQSLLILGPSPAILVKLKRKFRFRILLIAPKNFHIQRYITDWLQNLSIPSQVHIQIDIDPYNFW